jgi:hypothetical protein
LSVLKSFGFSLDFSYPSPFEQFVDENSKTLPPSDFNNFSQALSAEPVHV